MNNSPGRDRISARLPALIGFSLILVTVAAYCRVVTFDFVNLDDSAYITYNPDVFRGLSWKSFVWAFTAFHSANWHPLTWLSHMLDCQLFGDKAGWHHLTSLLFHAANTLLLFGVLKRMTGALWRSAIVAALFALHPLHTESVAWISERKDVLSTFFFLLTVWSYARHAEKTKANSTSAFGFTVHYFLALLFFALGLLSKPMLVTLPFVLLLLDYWPLKRTPNLRKLFIEKIPFFALTAASSVVTVLAQSKEGSVISLEAVSPFYRMVNAIVSYEIYLEKMFWPTKLAAYYPLQSSWPVWRLALGIAVLVFVSLFVLLVGRRARYLRVGWFWYLGTLLPVIGIVQVGTQSMADRYTYIPLIGIFIALVWGLGEIFARWSFRKFVLIPACVLVLVACVSRTWVQVGYWKNSETLFTHALKVTSNNWLAHYNLAHALSAKGRYDEAIAHCQEVLSILPRYGQAHFLWGEALSSQNRFDQAIQHYAQAVEMVPNYPLAHCHWANALFGQQKYAEAESHYLTALHLKSDFADAHRFLGNLYLEQGRLDGAIRCYREALRLNPENPVAHYSLGNALGRQKKIEQAAEQFREAVKLQPDFAIALNDLAWILTTSENPKLRDIPEAIRLSEHACALTRRRDANCLDTLSATYAAMKRFSDAATVALEGANVANDAGQKELAAQLKQHAKLYSENARSGNR